MDAPSVELLSTHDYQEIKQNIVDELTKASQGQTSSLSFIKHKLVSKPLITEGIVQGIVIGGTNYIVSIEELTASGERKILERRTGVLPQFKTRDDLINFLEPQLDERIVAIGMNFGFALEPVTGFKGGLDAKLVHAKIAKEHAFAGLDEPLGTLLQNLFFKKYARTILTSVANDTVCLLLAGTGEENGSLIAGTGVNAGIKIKDSQQTTLVNLELGNFDKFSLSPILQKIDADSEKPDTYLFEKTISGKYLARYFNEKAQELELALPPLATSQELSNLSQTDKDNPAGELARAIIKQSASLLATALAGIYEFSGKPEKFIFIGEGSMLWKGWQYREHIHEQLAALEIPSDAIEINHIKDSSINGAIGLITHS